MFQAQLHSDAQIISPNNSLLSPSTSFCSSFIPLWRQGGCRLQAAPQISDLQPSWKDSFSSQWLQPKSQDAISLASFGSHGHPWANHCGQGDGLLRLARLGPVPTHGAGLGSAPSKTIDLPGGRGWWMVAYWATKTVMKTFNKVKR